MAANRIQLQNALHKPYDRVLFSREVLSPVFGSGFTLNSSLVPAGVIPNKSESAAIDKVWIYGNIQLDDNTEITCYEVFLQPKVRIEQSKVAIQQYVRKLLTAGQGALINFVAPANKNVWRLTLVAKDSVLTEKGVKEKTTNAKRYTFLLGPSETCKTAAERFEVLSTEREITFQTLVNAFSVEKLSKAFFDEYTLHYQNFCDYLQESNYRKSVFNITFPAGATKQEKDKASKPIRDFVKKLLGRIVFLYFVQKKGWLGASDTNYTDGLGDFIKQLFNKSGGNDTFYSSWLMVLFFDTLNKERPNDDFTMPDACLPDRQGKTVKVPFLNGGLFDKEEFDEHILTFKSKLFHHPDFEDTILTSKNNGFARGFLDFLDAFNFTVYEDSPDDHTVAVDPEMLGHIFENLLEDNKDKGAFYTPKEIVHYMCQESLTEYCLSLDFSDYGLTMIDEDKRKLIESIIKKKEVDFELLKKSCQSEESSKSWFRQLEMHLDNVKICDPAIGSGAFPMGLLQEIFSIKELLAYETGKAWNPAETKLNIIQNSIYGVDIEKGAVDIARLRFWLSLVVDEEKPKALPNLDYKIVVGDSLISKFDGEIVEIDWERKSSVGKADEYVRNVQRLLVEVADKQKKYFSPNNKNKKKLQADIRNLKIELLINQLSFNKELYINKTEYKSSLIPSAADIKHNTEREFQIKGFDNLIAKLKSLLKNPDEPFNHFDWKLDFPEVLNPYLVNGNGGFDVVIGNPPYYQLREIDEKLQENYKSSRYFKFAKGGRLNVFQFFIPFAVQHAKKEGIICLITQNSLLGEDTAISNRKYIFSNSEVIRFDSFPERDNIKTRVFESVKMSVVISLLKRKITHDNTFKVWVWKDKYMSSKSDLIITKDEIKELYPENMIIPITSQKSLNILKTIKKLPNSYFLNSSAGEIDMTKFKDKFNIQKSGYRVYTGAQIHRYCITDEPQQGSVLYLKESLIPKSGKFKEVANERIVMQRITGVDSPVRLIMTLVPKNSLCANSVNFISNSSPNKLRYELGVLNSKLLNTYFKYTSTNTNITTSEINAIPLPFANKVIIQYFASFVNYVLHLKSIKQVDSGLMPIYFEQIIDGMVYELYFPELLKKHNREIIKHLGELPEFTDSMSDEQKMKICKKVFDRLNEKEHPVRINLEKMKEEIKEIRIIEGIEN